MKKILFLMLLAFNSQAETRYFYQFCHWEYTHAVNNGQGLSVVRKKSCHAPVNWRKPQACLRYEHAVESQAPPGGQWVQTIPISAINSCWDRKTGFAITESSIYREGGPTDLVFPSFDIEY